MLAIGLFFVMLGVFLLILFRLLGMQEFMAKSDEIVIYALFLSLIFTSALYLLTSLQARKIGKIIYQKDKKLKKQAAKISLKNSQQTSLIEGICHEIKNPVAIISLSAKSMDKSAFVDKIIYSCDKINKLLETLNTTFINGANLNVAQTSVQDIANELISELAPSYKGRKIIVRGQKQLECDKELMSLLLYNLCQNALKYSDDDVVINLRKSGIFVRDFGLGFDKSEKSLLFKKFYKSAKYKHSGSLGFGLWACNQICKLHGFKMIANSTRFSCTFGVLC